MHLGTAVLVICAAGVLVGLNAVPRGPLLLSHTVKEDGDEIEGFGWGMYRGWPLQFQEVEYHEVQTYIVRTYLNNPKNPYLPVEDLGLPLDTNRRPIILDPRSMSEVLIPESSTSRILAFLADMLLALGILGVVGVTSEIVLRRVYSKDKGP